MRRALITEAPSINFSIEKTIQINQVRWDRHTAKLKEGRDKATPEQIEHSRNIALRAAAVETGAIEGLYEVDRGFTFTVAVEAAAWETALAEKGEAARADPISTGRLRLCCRFHDKS